MHERWLSNAYVVGDEAGGVCVFVDSGAPLEPRVASPPIAAQPKAETLHREADRRQATILFADLSGFTGLFSLGKDVTPELAREVISSVRVVGVFRASQAVKDALADRMK